MGKVEPYDFVCGRLVLRLGPEKVALFIAGKFSARGFSPLVFLDLECPCTHGFRSSCRVIAVDVHWSLCIFEIDIIRRNPAIAGLVVGVVQIVGPVALQKQLARLPVHIVNDECTYSVPVCKTVLTRSCGILLVDVAAEVNRSPVAFFGCWRKKILLGTSCQCCETECPC